MFLTAEYLQRHADTLEQAILRLAEADSADVLYDLYRNAAIKSFELSLETTGKLLRKALKLYGGSPREVDKLVFNDVLRHAGKHGLLDITGANAGLITGQTATPLRTTMAKVLLTKR